MSRDWSLPDLAATEALARKVARALPGNAAGWTVLLQGELGSGKSTFVRALLHELGHEGAVPSPTYTLVEPYELANYQAYHVDLYRIATADELEFIGWSDLAGGLRLIEWPDRIPGLENDADLHIILSYAGRGRSAELIAQTDRGAQLLAGLGV